MKQNFETIILHQAVEIANLKAELQSNEKELLMEDMLAAWYLSITNNVEPNTLNTYWQQMKLHLLPFWRGQIANNIKPRQIEAFYSFKIKSGLSPNTVIKLHVELYSAFKYACKQELLQTNPMLSVMRPRQIPFHSSIYNNEQLNYILENAKDTRLFVPIVFAALLGLRRSEIVGLKWSCIDLTSGNITIRAKAMHIDSQDIVVDKTKTLSSYRTLCLPINLLQMLKTLKASQQQKFSANKELKENLKYICLDEFGNRIKLNYITNGWKDFIATLDIQKIRFHDLRHSCASLLLQNGVGMKEIQEWLGHSNYATTANIYAHLDMTSKEKTAIKINNFFNIE